MAETTKSTIPGTPEDQERWDGARVALQVGTRPNWPKLLMQVAAVSAIGQVAFLAFTAIQVTVMLPDLSATEGLRLIDWAGMFQGGGLVALITLIAAIPWLLLSARGGSVLVTAGPERLEFAEESFDSSAIRAIRWTGERLQIERTDGSVWNSEPIAVRDPTRLVATLSRAAQRSSSSP